MIKKTLNDLHDFLKNQPFIITTESEINDIFVEELYSSPNFQNWVIEKTELKKSNKFNNAWKSFHPKPGTECDIAVRFVNDKHSVILLIENKIDAPEQPNQAKRYQQSGEYLVKNKICDEYQTCLLCPMRYDEDGTVRKKYEKKISYEELLEWFEKQPNNERMKFKQMVIKNGIERARTGFKKIPDENTTKFHNYYRKIAKENYPELKLSEGVPQAKNTWIHIGHFDFPRNIKIKHKGRHGIVDLEISKISKSYKTKFSKWYAGKTEDKMTLEKTGKSISVRIYTQKISKQDIGNAVEPKKYRKEIVEALQAAERLKNWYLKWRNDPIFAEKINSVTEKLSQLK